MPDDLRVLWYWPHPHEALSPAAEPLLRAGDSLTVQCLETFRGRPGDDPRVEFRRELPEVRALAGVPGPVRRALRVETYVRRAVLRERLVRRGGFDVCHVTTTNYLVDPVALGRLRRRVPVVAVVHDVVPHESRLPAALERRMLERLYRGADVYVVLHEIVARRLVADFGLDPSRVVVAEHPVRPVPTDPVDDAGRLPDASDGEPPRFLFFGSFRTDKGLPILLDAARRLAEGPAGPRIHVAGGGDDALERVVGEAAAAGVITAEIGRVSAARKDELFRTADVVVLPYSDPERFQSQSGVLADAYGYRTPVLVADVGALGPTVRADRTGWVVPPGDGGALAERMRVVAGDPAARRDAASAIDAVLPKYSYEQYGQSLREAYLRAIDVRREGRS